MSGPLRPFVAKQRKEAFVLRGITYSTPCLAQSPLELEEGAVHGEYPLVPILDRRGEYPPRRRLRRGFVVSMAGVHDLKAMSIPFFSFGILVWAT